MKVPLDEDHGNSHLLSIIKFKSLIIYIIIVKRAKRARHSQVCSIENRGYIYIIGECGSTLYVGLSGIVRNLIQKSTV